MQLAKINFTPICCKIMCQLEESLHNSEVSYRCPWIYLQISCSSYIPLTIVNYELGSLLNGDLYLLYVAYPQLRKFENKQSKYGGYISKHINWKCLYFWLKKLMKWLFW